VTIKHVGIKQNVISVREDVFTDQVTAISSDKPDKGRGFNEEARSTDTRVRS
jgi:hypothetical protein